MILPKNQKADFVKLFESLYGRISSNHAALNGIGEHGRAIVRDQYLVVLREISLDKRLWNDTIEVYTPNGDLMKEIQDQWNYYLMSLIEAEKTE